MAMPRGQSHGLRASHECQRTKRELAKTIKKDLKYHFKYQIPIPLKFNQKKGQYRYNTGKCSTLPGSLARLCHNFVTVTDLVIVK
jgi:hypothetical protein